MFDYEVLSQKNYKFSFAFFRMITRTYALYASFSKKISIFGTADFSNLLTSPLGVRKISFSCSFPSHALSDNNELGPFHTCGANVFPQSKIVSFPYFLLDVKTWKLPKNHILKSRFGENSCLDIIGQKVSKMVPNRMISKFFIKAHHLFLVEMKLFKI